VTGAGPVLSVSGLTHRYGRRVALDHVQLDVQAGEVVGLLGPNGAGKTTLIRICCGLLRPTEGRALVGGVDPAKDPVGAARKFGYMPQRAALYDDLSAEDNLLFFATLQGLSGEFRRKRVEEILAEVALTSRRSDRVYALSGGLRQRLSLACALLHRPPVLFLDEPTVGIDPRVRRQIWESFYAYARAGAAIVVSTHQMDEAAHCARLVMMFDGKILRDGPSSNGRTGPPGVEDEFLHLLEGEAGAAA